MVDASLSMNHQDGSYSKIDYARYLAAAVGWLAHRQGDAIGLYVFRDGTVHALPARQDAKHLARFMHQLEELRPEGKIGQPIHYKNIFMGEQKRELLVFITDLY
jgi:uncharacterized protein (DUF58 family)